MTIKPWLSKNFLQMMSWSSVRDYPPKTKKAWLYDNFMEMEEIHSDHIEDPWDEPNDPLPPNPDIPQEPEEEDPCIGDRSLWAVANPSSIDCDVNSKFTLLFSPDFQCIELTQAFFDETKPHLVYGKTGKTLSLPTNIDDIIGDLRIEETCEDGDSITVWVSDCLCGGSSSVDISLSNCSIDCDSVYVDGDITIEQGTYTRYTAENFPANTDAEWTVSGTSVSIDQDGFLTAGLDACGMITIYHTSDCCGVKSLLVKITDGGVWVETYLCFTGSPGDQCQTGGFELRTFYTYVCGPSVVHCTRDEPCPCADCPPGEISTLFIRDEEWQCAP